MRDKVSRDGFPRTGSYLSVVRFICETPPAQRENVYVGPVLGKPSLFNFCLFAEPVTLTDDGKALIKAALDVARMSDDKSAG
jgi:hypothetical protein